MAKTSEYSRRRGERGQTILLVAISLVSLLAMAALAIDVVTLYVAKTEIQRAADAAALAGAKAIADSGITTLNSNDFSLDTPAIQNLATNMATGAINGVLTTNVVAGSAPSLVSAPTFNFTAGTMIPINSWQVTVTLQQTNLPTFFARIFGRTAASTQATATAEAYNPANITSTTTPSEFTPIAPRCVKPLLVANADPTRGGVTKPNLVTPSGANAGLVEAGLIGENFTLVPDCRPGQSTCAGGSTIPDNPPKQGAGAAQLEFLPALVATGINNVCPSSASGTCGAGSAFAQSIQCCDVNSFQSPPPLNCGGNTAANAQWDNTINPTVGGSAGTDLPDAIECLIHQSPSIGGPQDIIDYSTWPFAPPKIQAQGGATLVTTSNSIVTIPIIDTSSAVPATGGAVTIVGFIQAFVGQIDSSNNISITVMNVVGCGTPNAAPAVVGGNGASTIPVRLISQ